MTGGGRIRRGVAGGGSDVESRPSLEGTELLRALGPSHLERIRPHLQLRAFAAGEYLYFEAQPAQYLWVVRAGEVRTLKGSSSGRVTTLERLRPGDLFGMAAILEGARCAESAQGVVSGEVWRAHRRLLAPLLREAPELGQALLALVAKRLQGAHHRLCSFAHDSVAARIARVVLEEDNGERIEMTRRLLGESVGTTVETTIRVLRSFERAGWLEGGVGWIRVLDRKALDRVARGDRPNGD